MKISYNWLKEIYPTDLSPEAIDILLTAGGLEVENIEAFETVKGGMKGLVVGEVKTCIKHPDADKLKLTTVDVGTGELLQIVCGGPNVAAGQKVVVALPGTKIFPLEGEPFVIKQAKIRGQSSNGMICAEDEIGLGHSHAGVIVLPKETKVGTLASEYYNIKSDSIFEIGLTPNRADAASHLGVARDLAAIVRAKLLIETGKDEKKELVIPPVKELKQGTQKEINVRVENTKACFRYSGISIANVQVAESPSWLKNRLASIGVHPINNVVDITNFVLHEYGQPLHAFDIDTIKGNKIVVRSAKSGEKFTTLDKVERNLAEDDLMICDESSPMCMAGVFGGINSGITEKTINVFLESACFNPVSIRKTSKRHGLKTDASFRFERGTDPEITVKALNRAASLICEIANGEVASEVVDIYPVKILPSVFDISYSYLDRFSGEVIDRKVIQTILESLDIKILTADSEKLKIEVPAFKVDVTRPVDVVEEILRIYGYDRIPVKEKIASSLPGVVEFNKDNFQHKVAEYLSANGFNEIINNSLVKKEYASLIGEEESTAIGLLNPLSQELSILRQELLTTALETVLFNLNRKQNNLRFFEFGKIYFRKENKYKENYRFSILLSGNKQEESWKEKQTEVDFYLLKAYVKNVLTHCGIDAFSEMENSLQVFTQGMTIQKNKEALADFGMVSQVMLKKFDISQNVFYAELHWDTILKYASKKPVRYKEVSKFPAVKRDLSMLIRNEISYQQLEKIAFDAEKKLLIDIRLFDVYDGDKIEAGKKSCALSFILQDDEQTLTEQQINKVMDRLMSAYESEAGAEIRRA